MRRALARAMQNPSIVAETLRPGVALTPDNQGRRSLMKHPLQQATYLLTAAHDSQMPAPEAPEIAFAGRSNAGKSSAINALANQTRLAYASKTPGRTQQINFFRLRDGALLVDLPGYGYAAVPKELKRHWQDFLARYIAMRQSLIALVLVVDARHGLADTDRTLLDSFLPSGRPVLVLATKMDKLSASAQRTAHAAIADAMARAFPAYVANVTVVTFSATRRSGLEEAESVIARWLAGSASHVEPANAISQSAKKRPRDQGE
jgi:GTP-binding protein